MFLRKGVLKTCNKFTGEHPCQSTISIKLPWVFSCKFVAYFQNTFPQEHLWTADSANCSEIKLVIYQFAFCCFFSGAMVGCLISLFVVIFRKVLKHFLNLNTDESVSTVLIKNVSILHVNHLHGF